MIKRVCSLLVLSACASGAPPPPPAPPPDPAVTSVLTRPPETLSAAAIRAKLKPQRSVIYVVDGVQYPDSLPPSLGPDDIVSIEVPGGLNEVAPVSRGPSIIIIRTRHGSAEDSTSSNR